MTLRKFRFVRFICPHCKEMGCGQTHNKFITCGARRCERRFCWIRHQVSDAEWRKSRGITLEQVAKADAYIKAWLEKDRQRQLEKCR